MLQLINMFEEVCGVTIPYEIVERRQGDIVSMYANSDLAHKELNWKTKYSLREMCKCDSTFINRVPECVERLKDELLFFFFFLFPQVRISGDGKR